MKVYYKDQLVNEINQSYDELTDLPRINNILVNGEFTLKQLNIYTQAEIDSLIKAINTIYVSETDPTDPVPNSIYYVGTSAPYTVKMYLDDGTQLDMGVAGTDTYNTIMPVRVGQNQTLYLNIDKDTIKYKPSGKIYTDFKFNAGVGLEKVNDTFNLLVDDETISINADDKVEFNVFHPATSGVGKAGLTPVFNDVTAHNWILGGDAKWHYIEPKFEAGMIKLWPSPTIPSGWLACDGSSISRDVYSDLFAVIGTTYGEGDGLTTFNLPDMRSRLVVGNDGTTFGEIKEPNLPFTTSTVAIANATQGGFYTVYNTPASSATISGGTLKMVSSIPLSPFSYASTAESFDLSRGHAVYSDKSNNRLSCLEPANLRLQYIIKS